MQFIGNPLSSDEFHDNRGLISKKTLVGEDFYFYDPDNVMRNIKILSYDGKDYTVLYRGTIKKINSIVLLRSKKNSGIVSITGIGYKIKEFRYECGEMLSNGDTIIDRYILRDKNNKQKKYYKIMCKKGHIYKKLEVTKSSCPYCTHNKVSDDNRLKIINKQIYDCILMDENDKNDLARKSNVKVPYKCPRCGFINYNFVSRLTEDRPIPCHFCSDNTPLGERIINTLFSLYFPGEYEVQFRDNESNKIYDIVWNNLGKKIFIEIDGEQHRRDTNKTKQRIISINDKTKENIAVKKYDCYDFIRLKYNDGSRKSISLFQNEILQKLLPYFYKRGIKNIDFDKIKSIAYNTSMMLDVISLWEDKKTIDEISDILKISNPTVHSYLEKAKDCDFINDYPDDKKILYENIYYWVEMDKLLIGLSDIEKEYGFNRLSICKSIRENRKYRGNTFMKIGKGRKIEIEKFKYLESRLDDMIKCA